MKKTILLQTGERIFSLDKEINRIENNITFFTNNDLNDIYKSLKRFENIILKELERRL